MPRVDLNSDLGESYGRYTIGCDERIIPLISSANVACGFHASDPVVMMETIKHMKEAGGAIGAHPGFPDLMGFGRRNMILSYEEAKDYTLYQISAIAGMCKSQGMKLQHVKPHGAMYNMAGKDYKLAKAICEAIKEFDDEIIVMGLSGSKMIDAAIDANLRVAQEVFADRGYEEDGSLVNRSKDGAFIHDENEAIERVIRMIKDKKVAAVTGNDIDIQADSICVHGDGEKALLFVENIRKALIAEKIDILPLYA